MATPGDKPSTTPGWAASPVGAQETPSSAKKTQGWIAEKPSYKIFNWFWALISSWISYLDTMTTQNYNAHVDIDSRMQDQEQYSFETGNTFQSVTGANLFNSALDLLSKNLGGYQATVYTTGTASDFYNDVDVDGFHGGELFINFDNVEVFSDINVSNCENVVVQNLEVGVDANAGQLNLKNCNNVSVEQITVNDSRTVFIACPINIENCSNVVIEEIIVNTSVTDIDTLVKAVDSSGIIIKKITNLNLGVYTK